MTTETTPKSPSPLSPLPKGRAAQLARGFRYPLRGLELLRRHKLWGLAAVPMGIALVVLLAVFFATMTYAGDLRDLVWDRPDGDGILTSLATVGWYAFTGVFMVGLVVLDVLVYVVVGSVVASPFLDLLDERLEEILWGQAPPPLRASAVVRSVGYALLDLLAVLGFFLGFSVPLLLLNIVPVIGGIAAMIASGLWGWLLLSMDFLAIPLNRRLVPFETKWGIVKRHKWTSFGFGAAVWLFSLGPGLNLLLLPAGTVGAVLYYGDLRESGVLPARAMVDPV